MSRSGRRSAPSGASCHRSRRHGGFAPKLPEATNKVHEDYIEVATYICTYGVSINMYIYMRTHGMNIIESNTSIYIYLL